MKGWPKILYIALGIYVVALIAEVVIFLNTKPAPPPPTPICASYGQGSDIGQQVRYLPDRCLKYWIDHGDSK